MLRSLQDGSGCYLEAGPGERRVGRVELMPFGRRLKFQDEAGREVGRHITSYSLDCKRVYRRAAINYVRTTTAYLGKTPDKSGHDDTTIIRLPLWSDEIIHICPLLPPPCDGWPRKTPHGW